MEITEAELIKRARAAMDAAGPDAIAERIILFRRLLQSLEELLLLKGSSEHQRRILRQTVVSFVRTKALIRAATKEWSLGVALTRDLVENLDRLEEALNVFQSVLLADLADDSAMMAPNRPEEG